MVKRFSGPTVIETDDNGNNPVAIFTGPDKREIRSDDSDYAAAVVGAAYNIDARKTWAALEETFGSRTITDAGPVVMASATIPPLTAGGVIRVSGMFEMDTNAHTRTVSVRFGGQTFGSTTYTSQAGVVQVPFRFEIANVGSVSTQKAPSSFFNQAAVGTAFLSGTVDTSQAQLLEILGTVATYSMTLLWLNIETRGRA